MVNKPGNPTFAGGINNLFLVYSKEVAGTLVLKLSARQILRLSFISNTWPHYLTNIFDNLRKNGK